MAAGIEGFSSEAGEEIAREIPTGNPSSCQIAQRRRITKAMVDRMGKSSFWTEVYGRRGSLSEMNLCGQAADLLPRGASGNEISRIPGPARGTCHRLMGEAHPQEPLSRRQGAWPRPMAYHAKAGARLCKWPRLAPSDNASPSPCRTAFQYSGLRSDRCPMRPCHYTLPCSSTPPLRIFAFILQILLQKAMPMAVTVSKSFESMNFCA